MCIGLLRTGTIPLANPGKSEVLEMGRGTGTIMMRENTQKMWSSADLRPKSESSAVDPAFAVCPNWNPPCETGHVWPLPGPIPRFQLEHHNQVSQMQLMFSTAHDEFLTKQG